MEWGAIVSGVGRCRCEDGAMMVVAVVVLVMVTMVGGEGGRCECGGDGRGRAGDCGRRGIVARDCSGCIGHLRCGRRCGNRRRARSRRGGAICHIRVSRDRPDWTQIRHQEQQGGQPRDLRYRPQPMVSSSHRHEWRCPVDTEHLCTIELLNLSLSIHVHRPARYHTPRGGTGQYCL